MKFVKHFALVLTFLIISMPVSFAVQMNLNYDLNGNLISGDGKFREYNSLNQLVKVYNGLDNTTLLQEFIHDPVEERILVKTTYNPDSSIKEKVIYFSKNFIQIHNDSGVFNFTYVYHNGQLIAQQNPDGSKQFIHTDHLGSSTTVTDESGDVVENTSYSPYGEVLEGGANRFDYEGKEFDDNTGDYDFHFRKLNPNWGIFTQPDSLIPNVYNPQLLNRYMFEEGNPYKYIDNDGHEPLTSAATVGSTLILYRKIETAADVVGIVLDIMDIAEEWHEGGSIRAVSKESWISLGLDVLDAFAVFAPPVIDALPAGRAYKWVSEPGNLFTVINKLKSLVGIAEDNIDEEKNTKEIKDNSKLNINVGNDNLNIDVSSELVNKKINTKTSNNNDNSDIIKFSNGWFFSKKWWFDYIDRLKKNSD